MEMLCELLHELANDPWCRDAFERDPEAVLHTYALNPNELAQLRDGAMLSQLDSNWQRCTSVLDPGWDPTPNPDPPPAEVG